MVLHPTGCGRVARRRTHTSHESPPHGGLSHIPKPNTSTPNGEINPSLVFTHEYTLDEINQAYQDMADRKTIKSYIKVTD